MATDPGETAVAYPNIALIKYWGKRDEDHVIPWADSLSITLDVFRRSRPSTWGRPMRPTRCPSTGFPPTMTRGGVWPPSWTWCGNRQGREFGYAVSDGRETVRSVASAGDVVLVCDPEGEQAGDELLGWAGEKACPVHRVGRLSDLRSEWLADAATVGVAVTSPAVMPMAEELVTVLSGLGPLAAMRRRVVTEPFQHARTALSRVDVGAMTSRDRTGHAALVRHGSAALCVTGRLEA